MYRLILSKGSKAWNLGFYHMGLGLFMETHQNSIMNSNDGKFAISSVPQPQMQ